MKQIVGKLQITRWPIVLILAIVMLATSTESCKSTGKMSKKERKSQIEIAKKQLQSIISGTTTLSLPDQEKLASFAVLAERYGIKFDPAEAATPLGKTGKRDHQ